MSEKRYSTAHRTNWEALNFYPDGNVPFNEPIPPSEDRGTGSLGGCAYCGSMHPTDVVNAINAGARGEIADWKYGYPHKVYFHNVPNPHAGMMEYIGTANYQYQTDWIQVDEKTWRAPGTPARDTTMGKFYITHLQDATPEEKVLIEAHIGLSFTFSDDGKSLSWKQLAPDS